MRTITCSAPDSFWQIPSQPRLLHQFESKAVKSFRARSRAGSGNVAVSRSAILVLENFSEDLSFRCSHHWTLLHATVPRSQTFSQHPGSAINPELICDGDVKMFPPRYIDKTRGASQMHFILTPSCATFRPKTINLFRTGLVCSRKQRVHHPALPIGDSQFITRSGLARLDNDRT
jgi:hypothetical protein